MTTDEVKTAFLTDLRILLAKWGAEIDLEDDRRGYDKDIVFTISSVHDDDCNTIIPYTTINVGKSCTHLSLR